MSRRTNATVARATIAALTLVAVLVGLPVALSTIVGWPLPHAVPAPSTVVKAIGDGYLPDRFIIDALAVALWALWAAFAVCVVIETVATARGRLSHKIPLSGLMQPIVANLIAAIALAIATAGIRAAVPPLPTVAAPAMALIATHDPVPSAALENPIVTTPETLPSYVVKPRDDLWSIAERHLGDPFRWKEIHALNRAIVRDPNLIQPGWIIALPADATALEGPPTPSHPAEPASQPPAEHLPTASTAPPQTAPTTTVTDASPAETAGPDTVPAAEPDDGGGLDLPSAVPIAAVGLVAMVSGSAVWRLDRARRIRRRRRRPGAPLPDSEPRLEAVELKLRAVAATDAVATADAINRHLGSILASFEPDERPHVRATRVGSRGVEILLDRPAPAPPDFLSEDNGRTWRLDPAVSIEDLRALGTGRAPAMPATVTIGGSPEGPVLVDLEECRSLQIVGDDNRVRAFLRGVTLELATAPWSVDVTVHSVNGTDPEPDDVSSVGDAAQAVAAVAAISRQSTAGDRRTGRLLPDGDPADPTVVVAWDAGDAAPIQAVMAPGAPVALVTTGPADTRLMIRADGSARLEPLGLDLHAVGIDDDLVDEAVALIEASEGDIIDLRDDSGDVPPGMGSAVETTMDAPGPPTATPLVHVRVLGPVEITGWATAPQRPKATELVTYIACHGRPVQQDRLRAALWVDGITDQTFKSAVSRSRRWLGVDETGEDHLRPVEDGRYQLGPAAWCDWQEFRRLCAVARRAADPDDAMAAYRAALELVRGDPFAEVPAQTYGWAWAEQLVSDIEVAVSDAAAALGELALEHDDADTAAWAASQGLLVCPGHEALYQVRMRAAGQAGDLDAVDQAFREATRAARADDPLDDVQPETRRLYLQLSEPDPMVRRARRDS
jgi:hypothetical protein